MKRPRPFSRGDSVMCLLAWTLTLLLLGGTPQKETSQERDSTTVKNAVTAILESHTMEWMTIPGVVGTAEGVHRGKPCVLILVEKKTPKLQKTFPDRLNGIQLVLKEVGKVKKR